MSPQLDEFYNWVNVDRKEYICPYDFDCGYKSHQSIARGNACLCALRELLAGEWAGSHVLFLGDELFIPADSRNETLKMLYDHTVQAGYPGNVFMTVDGMYKNISGLFRAAEALVRPQIDDYLDDLRNRVPTADNEYGVDPSDPCKGLFLRSGKSYRGTAPKMISPIPCRS